MSGFLSPDNLTKNDLAQVGIEDTARALRAVLELAGEGVTDDDLAPLLPPLLAALRACPDPDRALHSFSRWFTAVGSRYSHLQTLIRHTVALDLFCLVTGSSQYFADLLARQPEYFEIIANPGVRGGTKSAATLYRDLSALVDACRLPELKRDALRRWKAREMLRIGVRDLAGLADMPATAREFSNLADACVQKACDIAAATLPLAAGSPNVPFAVIGMGKLGGQELNYSSDIDLMFVHGDDLPEEVVTADGRRLDTTIYLIRMAEAVVKTLSEESANGHVFRVDMRLRPEGRFGPLTRSLASCRAYYESWAENWERQALLKARFVAGDRSLGAAFLAMITPFVYSRHVSAEFLADIRANKRRIEKKCAAEGQTFTNVKTGYGGIRDVEFLVQLLQLAFGGARPNLRTPNTLAALQHLRHERFLTPQEAHELADDYQFLRTLEHRLQLLHGFQTQTLPPPKEEQERMRVARRMGFVDAAAFESELTRRRERLHASLERLFYGEHLPGGDAAAPDPAAQAWADIGDLLDTMDIPAAREHLSQRLTETGFRDIPSALHALQMPMRGNEFGEMPPDTPVRFRQIAPRLMSLLAHCPDPDAGLGGIEALALAVPNRAHLYAAFEDSPDILRKLVLLASAAPPLMKRLGRHQEWMETLLSPEEEEKEEDDLPPYPLPKGKGRLSAGFDAPPSQRGTSGLGEAGAQRPVVRGEVSGGELAARVQGAKTLAAKWEALARYHQREILRIGASDAWDEADVPAVMAALTRLAEEVLQTLLDVCTEPLIAAHAEPDFARAVLSRVAVIGLGKLGGAELGYGSDWDVVFVYDEERKTGEAARGAERFALVNTLVERVISAGKDLVTRGAAIEIDLRLRPWGRKGALIYTLHGFLDYYRTTGETWERQAALKARLVAGNHAVGRRFARLLHAVSFGKRLTAEEDSAIQAMKHRIESERLKPAERETDLKLGHGGLSDIEWLTQRLQLRYGADRKSLRVTNTLQALSALATARLLDNAEADVLIAAYGLLTRLRNAVWLQTGASHDALPSNAERRRSLALRFGYADDSAETAQAALWNDVHAHMQEVRRIFLQRFYEPLEVT